MRNLRYLHRLTLWLVIILLVVACDSSHSAQGQSDFDKLCTISKETQQKHISPDMQAFEITTRAKKEVPDMLVHLQLISMANPEDAYPLIKKVAENATKKPWVCKVMKDYYNRAYKKAREKLEREKLDK